MPFEQARAQVVQAEQANIRSALAWAVAHGARDADAAELGMRLVVALFLWYYHEAIREGQQWATTIVSLPGASARTALRAHVRSALATQPWAVGERIVGIGGTVLFTADTCGGTFVTCVTSATSSVRVATCCCCVVVGLGCSCVVGACWAGAD